MKIDYYEVLDSNSKTDYWIKWNTTYFAPQKTGFIIQHMNIESHIDCVQDANYWESWEVVDGKIVPENKDYDDNWSPIPELFISSVIDDISESADGLITYSAKVYFVPVDSSKYELIRNWKVVNGSPAYELKMTYIFDEDVDDYYLCSRRYEWNYKELSLISDENS